MPILPTPAIGSSLLCTRCSSMICANSGNNASLYLAGCGGAVVVVVLTTSSLPVTAICPLQESDAAAMRTGVRSNINQRFGQAVIATDVIFELQFDRLPFWQDLQAGAHFPVFAVPNVRDTQRHDLL